MTYLVLIKMWAGRIVNIYGPFFTTRKLRESLERKIKADSDFGVKQHVYEVGKLSRRGLIFLEEKELEELNKKELMQKLRR